MAPPPKLDKWFCTLQGSPPHSDVSVGSRGISQEVYSEELS